jgi:phosphoribosyl 1,2-cyclic phosphate phosphodiesterase
MLYATDTSLLGEAAWELLQSVGPLDLILLDATAGLRPGGSGHHGFREFIDTRARMVREGLAGPKTRFVAHHFSHNGGLTYPALVDKYKPYDVDVSYDGLTFYL